MYMKKIKTKRNLFYKIISILLIISSFSFLGILFYLDLLPVKYSFLILVVIILFDILNIFLINLKKLKKKVKRILTIFIILTILVMTIASFFIGKTLGVLINNVDSKYKMENYSVIVLKNSEFNDLKDIKNEKIGYYKNSTGSKEANNFLEDKISISLESYNTSDNLVQDLLRSKINVILIEDSIKNIMEEEIDNFATSTKVIYTFTIETEVESTLKEVDVTKEPFAVYISGIDTYGKISSVSRSDVNMVMVINPKIHQVLLISIPRDYYVELNNTKGAKDKLTHAGIYGIDMSIQTIENLLDLDINYYLKVNFTSVIGIVDALGGLQVYSEYDFISYSGYKFKAGLNTVNGEQALDFARTRKAFVDGDRQRGKNQQALIEALIRKVTDKSIITKYNSLLDAVNGKYQTNLSIKKITSLIKMQLNDMPSWNVTSYSLTGTDSYNYTYTYNQLLYVMEPEESSVNEAINLIKDVLDDKNLDNSYNYLGGTSNKVTQVQINTNDKKENIEEEKIKEEDIKEEQTKEEEELELEEKTDEDDEPLEDNENEQPTTKEDEEDIESEEQTPEEPLDPILPTPDLEN